MLVLENSAFLTPSAGDVIERLKVIGFQCDIFENQTEKEPLKPSSEVCHLFLRYVISFSAILEEQIPHYPQKNYMVRKLEFRERCSKLKSSLAALAVVKPADVWYSG